MGLVWDKLPAVHCLIVGEERRVGKRKRKGMVWAAPQRVNLYAGWVLCLETFVSLLQEGILGNVPGEAFSRILITFPGVLF